MPVRHTLRPKGTLNTSMFKWIMRNYRKCWNIQRVKGKFQSLLKVIRSLSALEAPEGFNRLVVDQLLFRKEK